MLQLSDPEKAPVASAEEGGHRGSVETRFWQETGKRSQFYLKKTNKKKNKTDTELKPKSDEKSLKTVIIVNHLDKRKPNGPTQYSSVKTVV